ncbi:MAG: extracellular solute-binding protein [Spirochaetales bacterium]|nr:extracellular solute-binding protein [Spirochaetales bacterium]
MRKVVFLLLALLVATSLFAQGAAESSSASADKPVTLRLVHYMGEQTKRDGLDAMIAKFEETHPNVKVDIEVVNSTQYIAAYKNYIAADEMPDILFGKPQNMTEFIQGGYFKDLSGEDYMKNVLGLLKEECTVNGGIYGFPIDAQVKGVFYNKDMFKQYGVEVPQTRDEFFAACDKFQASGVLPIIHPLNFIHGCFHELDAFFTAMAIAKGDTQVWMDSQNNGKKLAENPMMVEAFEIYNKLLSYKDPGDTAIDQPQGIQNFAAGKRPMYINGGWLIGDVTAAAPNTEFGLFPMPWSNNAEENKVWVGIDDCFIVAANTKHPQEVHDLLAYFASDEASLTWVQKAKLMTSNVNVALDGANPLLQSIKPFFDSGKIAAKAYVPDYTSQFSTAFRQTLQAWCALSAEERSVDKLLTEIDSEIANIRK